jgi:hypothetical protein
MTEGTVQQLDEVMLSGIYTELDCDNAQGLFLVVSIFTDFFSALVGVTLQSDYWLDHSQSYRRTC